MRASLFTFHHDTSMVAPSCCLEYRPTWQFWAILIFIVFPFIYLAGTVFGTVLMVLARILRALCKWALWDEEDYQEEAEELRQEKQAAQLDKEEARKRRRKERLILRNQAAARELTEKNEKVISLMTNGGPRNGSAKCGPTSDVGESLNSECDTDEHRVTPPVADHRSAVSEQQTVTTDQGTMSADEDVDPAEMTQTTMIVRPWHPHQD
ncbi:hypothetical protein Q1695_009183 [Nippostrongylus brasiliensis]|nr:hypothetical protein Q1695_009183 [Nippostrongylus brasiliensis]